MLESREFHDIHAAWDGNALDLRTGYLQRRWKLTPHGLKTELLRHTTTGRVWNDARVESGSDWSVFVLADGTVPGELLEFSLSTVENDPFLSPHLEAIVIFRFPYLDSHFDLRWRLWAYPGTSGMRTQIALRAGREFHSDELPGFLSGSFAERFAFDYGHATRMAAGYYNDTQHRNFEHTPLLKEEIRREPLQAREIYDWANLLQIEDASGGLALVKESHKCVNQPGFDTGAFVLWPGEIGVSGLGYDEAQHTYWPSRKYHVAGQWIDAWATWIIAYEGDGAAGIKKFDRARFAPRIERDLRLKSNTWGTRGSGDASRAAATEENVLREIESCADLGLDLIEIDDGWQHDPRGSQFTPEPPVWRPHAERFPRGWDKVREVAARKGIHLALWAPGYVDESDLLWNLKAGNFEAAKLDFMNFRVREELDDFLEKIRRLSEARHHKFRVNCDATENMVRLGYYLGREFGVLFLSNRELPGLCGKHVAYHPHLQLREAWHLTKYFNLNQALLTVVDPDTVPRDLSTAHRYSHSYCFATAMMGLPLFFMETHTLSPAAREELRPLIALYKQHCAAIFNGFVSPIGDEPNDASWSGFLCQNDHRSGYITLFREQANTEPCRDIALTQLQNRPVRWTNLLTGHAEMLTPTVQGFRFELPSPASFVFGRYET